MKAEKNKIQRETVRRIMLQNFRKNRLQNRILILAVVLVTILMTVIFGAGVSLVHNVQQANELLQGTLANGFFPGAAEEEMEAAGDLKEVFYVLPVFSLFHPVFGKLAWWVPTGLYSAIYSQTAPEEFNALLDIPFLWSAAVCAVWFAAGIAVFLLVLKKRNYLIVLECN